MMHIELGRIEMTRNVFIIGAKGIPANYGGFESFVEQLTARKESGLSCLLRLGSFAVALVILPAIRTRRLHD